MRLEIKIMDPEQTKTPKKIKTNVPDPGTQTFIFESLMTIF